MKKLFVVLLIALAALVSCTPRQDSATRSVSGGQNDSLPQSFQTRGGSNVQKYALVIGNGDYTGIGRLNNPVNDANDVAAALQGLGFTVDTLLNASQEQMESAAIHLKNRLSASKNSYGLLFYAGHGVQSGGENYLIPVDANIQSESFLRSRTVSVQAMLDELNDAGNELNIVVLDACRDNPFSWSRSGNRGLSVVAQQPADSIIVFATSAGSTAADGTGRNGLFTGHFIKHLITPGLEVNEVFRLTMGDVARASDNQQRPAVYNQFSGIAYLGARPAPAEPVPVQQPAPVPAAVFETGEVSVATGSLEISAITAGTLEIRGETVNQKMELPAWGTLPVAQINAGAYRVTMRYGDGKTEEKTVEVGRSETVKLEFSYRPAQPSPAPTVQPTAPKISREGISYLTQEEMNEPVLTGDYRYTMNRTQTVDAYDKALSFFSAHRDEAARVQINRILESNAAEGLKNKARLMLSYMEVPNFESFKRRDNISFAEAGKDPVLYNNVHVIWQGKATNIEITDNGTTFNLLIDYNTSNTLSGIVQVKFNYAVLIRPELPVEVLGRIISNGGSIQLEGVSSYQSIIP